MPCSGIGQEMVKCWSSGITKGGGWYYWSCPIMNGSWIVICGNANLGQLGQGLGLGRYEYGGALQ